MTTTTPELTTAYHPEHSHPDAELPPCAVCGQDIAIDPFAVTVPAWMVQVRGAGPVCEDCVVAIAPTDGGGRAALDLAESLSALHNAMLWQVTDDCRRGLLGLALDGVQQIAQHFRLTTEEAS